MSGFSDDVLSILRHNNLFHNKSIGLLLDSSSEKMRLLMAELDGYNLISSGMEKGKWFTTWDYIVIPHSRVSAPMLLRALTKLNSGGIIIAEITNKQSKYQDKYLRLGTGVSATKVRYGENYYLVIHPGEDYGN